MKTSSLRFCLGRAALILSFHFCLAFSAFAACDLNVLSAYPCDSAGNATNPKFGDSYWIKVIWQVTGTPAGPYSILFKMAGQTYTWSGITTSEGSGYYGFAGFVLPLDGPIPWSITLDPDNVSGDTKLANNVISGTLTPTPPSKALEYFNPKKYKGTETFTVNWNVGGIVSGGYTVMGAPVTGSFQTVNNSTGPAGGVAVVTTPDGDTVWQTTRTNYTPTADSHQWVDTTHFAITVKSARTNIASMRAVTWDQLAHAAKHATYLPYTQPDTWVQSTDPAIVSFVKSVLPAHYKTTMTPYDAARALYMAVVQRTTYVTPSGTYDAVSTLNYQQGDCGNFTNLCSACFRSIGIPARANTGFWTGTSSWHVKGEFYLPAVGWIPVDASESRLFDPSGTYAYYFGSDATLNEFCAIGRGDDHRSSQFAITSSQGGWMFYLGNAFSTSWTNASSLK